MNSTIWKWEMLGIPFIVLIGSGLHFAFEWSGFWPPVAIVASVNESVWEHLKMAFWPSFAWAFIVYGAVRGSAATFGSAMGFGLLVAPISIIVIFYGYTAALGRNVLALDIATFIVAIILGQILSAALLSSRMGAAFMRSAGILLFLSQVVAFSTLTYFPAPLSLFEDSRTGLRGIPSVKRPQPGQTAAEATPNDATDGVGANHKEP